ncbi:Uncharacterised protein [uncultured Roseburia sp.]|uniref:Nuclear transport factor 2 family protein n=1 Tax=Brotonthovivens ammoniilytica TaxID=2981725 RepID=A0ABT2TNJ1_9FIRM|nr:nuclear transport factor 2 family protein [Brotonthovivens ammoniilytica]MCU6763647.1 nuclear transport factor 2 family protein [Brotonthovivens ammoniilytica]SCJ29314.1 Uncharacterised protein [uncultured Roseburia sp.]
MERDLEIITRKMWIMQQCRNQMGRYQFFHSAKMHQKTAELFANRDDCWIENNDLGFFRGPDGIRRFFVDFHKKMDGDDLRGSFCQHDLTTEIMEAADDLKTCKAVWLSPGVETRRDPKTGKLTSYWCWVKYAVDFIEDCGTWKFWHFTIYSDFFCDYYTAWVDVPYTTSATDDMLAPDETISADKSYVYTKDTVPVLWPKPPVPYKTYERNTLTERQEQEGAV